MLNIFSYGFYYRRGLAILNSMSKRFSIIMKNEEYVKLLELYLVKDNLATTTWLLMNRTENINVKSK